YRHLDTRGERLRNDLGAQQVEPQMRELVRLWFAFRMWHDIPANHIQTNGCANLDVIRAHNVTRRPETFGSFRSDESRVKGAIRWMRQCGRGTANSEDHPGRFAPRERLEVGGCLVRDGRESSVFRHRRCLRLLQPFCRGVSRCRHAGKQVVLLAARGLRDSEEYDGKRDRARTTI